MQEIPGYGKIISFGKTEAQGIVGTPYPIVVQEKVDGSQFSFCFNGTELLFRSKSATIYPGSPNAKMFEKGMHAILEATGQGILLFPNYIYRGEYLQKPKHNVLCYDRVPDNHVAIFDIQDPHGNYLRSEEVALEANKLGLDVVPYKKMVINSPEDIFSLMDTVSFLGGAKIEGLVIKDYAQQGPFGGPLMVKHVSEAFKEVHRGDWKDRHPNREDLIALIIGKYKTPARWDKAMQHLKERGELTDSPKDIGPLMKEAVADVLLEEGADIKEMLFSHFWKQIGRGVTAGLPEWYKEKLVTSTFEKVADDTEATQD